VWVKIIWGGGGGGGGGRSPPPIIALKHFILGDIVQMCVWQNVAE